jgi:serine protease Do
MSSRRLIPVLAGAVLLAAVGAGVALTPSPNSTPAGSLPAPDATHVVPAASGDEAAKAAREAGTALPDLIERLLPSVVNIATMTGAPGSRPNVRPDAPYEEYFREFFERNQDPRRSAAVGSGFIIDAEGHVVTNNHVIQNASEVRVVLHDGTALTAKVVGRDTRADLAVLKIEGKDVKLQPVVWGRSEGIRIGDTVVAIGNPFGLGGTVTTGIISARQRHLQNFGGVPGNSFVDFLQTDAAINKGNSGGPLFNMRGEVIGINTAIYSRQGTNVGIAFAVPSDLASPIVDQLRKHGRTKRGWLGVQIKDVDEDVAKALNLKSRAGALVVNAIPGSPAAEAGILAGDVITKFDGKAVPNERRLPQIVASTEVGRTVEVLAVRKGQEMTFKVRLGELEKALETGALEPKKDDGKPVDGTALLGMKLAEGTPEIRQRFNIRDGEGVVIVEVDAKSQAAEKGVKPGDLIVEMDLTKVSKPTEVGELLKKAEQARKTSVLLLVQRGEDRRFVALKIGEQPKQQ